LVFVDRVDARAAGLARAAGHLSFRVSYSDRLETDGSAQAFFQGTFDRAGAMSGSISFEQPTFTRDGSRYACRNGGGAFTAKLQR
jgi:hypothetical protein